MRDIANDLHKEIADKLLDEREQRTKQFKDFQKAQNSYQ